MSDSIYVLDRDLRFVMANKACADFNGIAKERLIGARLSDLFPRAEQTNFSELYLQVMREQVPADLVESFTYPDGRSAWYEVRAFPVQDGVLGISRDITG